ncbi:MAG: hypothetical protein H6736_01960 [Alphaproteobacteria bacterium]|nr:hypothetical protein [Alphaproteobacteria bacterium]MCB9690557.1 hypothetical protein [Alphaproteobacteria bacterium]
MHRVVLATLFLVGCVSASEHQALERRVAALEKQLGVEPPAASPARRPRGRKVRTANPQPDTRATGEVTVTGTTGRVFLREAHKRHSVPGPVPEGSYSIRVETTAGQPPVPAGQAAVEAGKTTKITCDDALRVCRAEVTPPR